MIIGIDIGGTKCAVIQADDKGNLIDSIRFSTSDYQSTLGKLLTAVNELKTDEDMIFGIACGGPLDSQRGLILSPPNLPGWDQVPITKIITDQFGGRAFLMNDANAGALAELWFGAGIGCRNMVFLTFGTGLGAGIIIDGKLYEGTCGMAGEVGHIRLAESGPVGYNKAGSFEGFCSGAGISQIASKIMQPNMFGCEDFNAKDVAEAARRGDPNAKEIFEMSAMYLGRGLSLIIDLLNPEIVVLGSLYVRCADLYNPVMLRFLKQETLPMSLNSCKIVSAQLGEKIGDYAAISVALNGLQMGDAYESHDFT